ncbi:tetratricopeptide repeat protein [Sulfurimonas sp.]|uniref:tetratricopeptide repeat protein n=1 Tax=Sulfurimonas sp. TaxID=2022749 RepID=UPI002B482DB5|nr:tetratricopeptide repeat protein [Sulfurimonas sp.]
MKRMFKIFILLFVFASQSLLAEQDISDEAFKAYKKGEKLYQTKKYDEALKWFKISFDEDSSKDLAFNIGLTYDELKDYPNAIKWYRKAFEMGDKKGGANLGLLYDEKLKDYPKAIKWYKKAIKKGNVSAINNLAILYKQQKDYPNAIKWYKKAFEMGNLDGAYNLGCLYDVNKKDFKNAIIWYKKAAKKGHKKAINNLGEVYHDLKDNITASAYVLAGIVYGYDKQETFKYLNKTWKIDEPTMIKAYKLQQTLDIPKHYIGDID